MEEKKDILQSVKVEEDGMGVTPGGYEEKKDTPNEGQRDVKKLLTEQKNMFKIRIAGENLYDLKEVEEFASSGKLAYLSDLDVSRNNLTELTLTNIDSLLRLTAAKNLIQNVRLSLRNLEHLDVSNCSLSSIPNLSALDKLKVLFLNKNYINAFEAELLPINLNTFDISENEIEFKSSTEYQAFLDSLKRFRSLRSFSIDDNPFTSVYPKYRIVIAARYSGIEEINKKPIAQEEIDSLTEEQKQGREASEKEEKAIIGGLQQMIDCVVQAMQTPPLCRIHLSNLKLLSEQVVKQEAIFESECQGEEQEKDFFEQLDLLHSTFIQSGGSGDGGKSQANFRKDIYLVLVNMASLRKMGSKALHQLGEFMKSSQQVFADTQDHLKKIVVKGLSREAKPENLNESLLKGLCDMGKEIDLREILSPILINFLDFLHKDTTKSPLDPEAILKHRTLIIGVLAAGLKYWKSSPGVGKDSVIQLMIAKEDFVKIILKYCSRPTAAQIEQGPLVNGVAFQEYKYILSIICSCCKASQTVATNFAEAYGSHFLFFLEESLLDYKKYGQKTHEIGPAKMDSSSAFSAESFLLTCELFSAEIETFAGMLNAGSDKVIAGIFKQPQAAVIAKVLSEMKSEKVDPKVLAGICCLALALFKSKTVSKDKKRMKEYAESIEYASHLLWFFPGKRRWEKLCEQAAMYQKGTTKGKGGLKISEIKQQFLYDVIASLVDLLNHICSRHRDIKCESYQIFQEMNEKLPELQREDTLFDLLKIPSDDVKLAVVNCLNNVALNQFSANEVGRMVTLLMSYKNPTGGRTELVLAKLLWILSRIVRDTGETGLTFKNGQAEAAIKDCIIILLGNMKRDAEGEEISEKIFLSVSAVHFLKACSTCPELEIMMAESNKNDFRLAVQAEEETYRKTAVMYSTQIERCALGSTVKKIMYAYFPTPVVKAYSPVCLRLMQALADIVSNNYEYIVPNVFPEDIKDPNLAMSDTAELIKKYIHEDEAKRKEIEKENWQRMTEDKAANDLDNMGTSRKEKMQKQIREFVDNYYIENLLRYFYGDKQYNATSDLENFIKDHTAKAFGEEDALKEMKIFVKQSRTSFEKEHEFLKESIGSKGNGKKNDSKTIGDKKGTENLLVEQLKKVGAENVKKENMIDRGISLQEEEEESSRQAEKGIANKKGESELGSAYYQDPEYRAMVLAALMRAIYYSYMYYPEKRRSIIGQLMSSNNLLYLTRLCYTTDWFTANVGAKYLRIIQLIFRVYATPSLISEDIIWHQQIVAIALRRMLELLFDKMKNEDKTPLTMAFLDLICEISRAGKGLISQFPYIDYYSLQHSVPEIEEAKVFTAPSKDKKTPGETPGMGFTSTPSGEGGATPAGTTATPMGPTSRTPGGPTPTPGFVPTSVLYSGATPSGPKEVILRGKPRSVDKQKKIFIIGKKKPAEHGLNAQAPQMRCAEFFLNKLLPYEKMYTYISVMFYYQRQFTELCMDSSLKLDKKMMLLDRIGKMHGRINNTGQIESASEWTITLFGYYMALCEKQRYKVSEDIIKMTIDENKSLRHSFLQEMLGRFQERVLARRLEESIHDHYYQEEETGLMENRLDRVFLMFKVDYMNEGDRSMSAGMLVVTNKRIYVYKPYVQSECTACSIDFPCWEPSAAMDPIEISNITAYIEFEKLAQVFSISYGKKEAYERQKRILFVSSRYRGGRETRRFMKQVNPGIVVVKDAIFCKYFLGGIKEGKVNAAFVTSASKTEPPERKRGTKELLFSDPSLCIMTGSSKLDTFFPSKWRREKERGENPKQLLSLPHSWNEWIHEVYQPAKSNIDKKTEKIFEALFLEKPDYARKLKAIEEVMWKKSMTPVLALLFKEKSKQLFLEFSCDFALEKAFALIAICKASTI